MDKNPEFWSFSSRSATNTRGPCRVLNDESVSGVQARHSPHERMKEGREGRRWKELEVEVGNAAACAAAAAFVRSLSRQRGRRRPTVPRMRGAANTQTKHALLLSNPPFYNLRANNLPVAGADWAPVNKLLFPFVNSLKQNISVYNFKFHLAKPEEQAGCTVHTGSGC